MKRIKGLKTLALILLVSALIAGSFYTGMWYADCDTRINNAVVEQAEMEEGWGE